MIYGNSLVNIPRLALHMAMLKLRGMENVPTLVLVPFKNFPGPPLAELTRSCRATPSLTSSIPDELLVEMFGGVTSKSPKRRRAKGALQVGTSCGRRRKAPPAALRSGGNPAAPERGAVR